MINSCSTSVHEMSNLADGEHWRYNGTSKVLNDFDFASSSVLLAEVVSLVDQQQLMKLLTE